MAVPVKPVTKTALSAFVREHSSLNLTQSKAVTDELLSRFDISVKQPVDAELISIQAGQHWKHTKQQNVLLVTGVETGPLYVSDSQVAVWGEISIAWEDTEHPDRTGTVRAAVWRDCMELVENCAVPTEPEESSPQP